MRSPPTVIVPRVGPVEGSDEVQERALPGAGRAGQRDELTRLDPQ